MIRKMILVAGLIGILLLGGVIVAQDATPTLPVEGEMPAEGIVPAEGEVIEGPTLESVTADPSAVYGQEVTLEGVLAEFVNVRTFVLSEGVWLDNDKVLVINNTPNELDPSLVAGGRVRITGVVMPSYNEGGFDQAINNFRNMIMPAQAPVEPQPATEATPADATSAEATPGDATAADATPAEGVMNEATDAEPTPDSAAPVDATPAEGGEPVEATPALADATPMAPPADTSIQAPAFSPESMDFTLLTRVIEDRFSNFTIVEINAIDSVAFIPPAE